MTRRTPTYYEVRPRYTPGSPGSHLPERTALEAVRSERESYQAALEGVYGDAEKARAERLGLSHIVFTRTERARKKGWLITDLITGEERTEHYADRVKGFRAKHPETGNMTEVELVGPDPDEHYHAYLVRSPFFGQTWSIPRWQLEQVTGRRKGVRR